MYKSLEILCLKNIFKFILTTKIISSIINLTINKRINLRKNAVEKMKYKNRYKESDKQNTYMNACDCLYYGYGIKYLIPCGEYTEEEKTSIWNQAVKDMSNGLQ